jgi:hypothetical protein
MGAVYACWQQYSSKKAYGQVTSNARWQRRDFLLSKECSWAIKHVDSI